MITRLFRARVPQSLTAEFEKKFLSVSVPYVEAAAGLVSVSVARPTRWIPDEYAMISIWRSEDDVAAFAGDDWNRAVIPAVWKSTWRSAGCTTTRIFVDRCCRALHRSLRK
jgi:heme-degrading monooxygenase HmoA